MGLSTHSSAGSPAPPNKQGHGRATRAPGIGLEVGGHPPVQIGQRHRARVLGRRRRRGRRAHFARSDRPRRPATTSHTHRAHFLTLSKKSAHRLCFSPEISFFCVHFFSLGCPYLLQIPHPLPHPLSTCPGPPPGPAPTLDPYPETQPLPPCPTASSTSKARAGWQLL